MTENEDYDTVFVGHDGWLGLELKTLNSSRHAEVRI